MSISMPDSPQLRSSTHTQNRGGRSNIYSSSKCTDGSFSTTHSVLQYNFSSYKVLLFVCVILVQFTWGRGQHLQSHLSSPLC